MTISKASNKAYLTFCKITAILIIDIYILSLLVYIYLLTNSRRKQIIINLKDYIIIILE